MLPRGTRHHGAPLSFEGVRAGQARGFCRQRWLDKALDKTRPCQLVFLDPDTGLEVSSIKATDKGGPKYVYLDELPPYYTDRGQSLIIYQHIAPARLAHFHGTAQEQVQQRLKQLENQLKKPAFAMLYSPGGEDFAAFLIVPEQDHWPILKERTSRFLGGPWGDHFDHICRGT